MPDRPRLDTADAPSWRHPAVHALLWGAAYYGAGQLGLLTEVRDRPLTLVAPSSGFLVVWFATASRRTLPWDVGVLAVASMSLSWQLGLPALLVLTGPPTGLAQVAVFVAVMRRGAADLLPFGTLRTHWRLRDLAAFLPAAVLASATSAGLSTLLQAAQGLPTGDLTTFCVRWGRGAATIVAVGSFLLLVTAAVRSAGVASWPSLRSELRAAVSARAAEALGLVALSVAAYVVCFYVLDGLPLMFVLFVATAWAGARFSPLATSAHALGLGAMAVVFTLRGHGVFATIDDPLLVALVAQLFVLVVSATGLTLALTRAEMADARRLADDRARLLDDVLYDIDDGVLVLDTDGRFVFANPSALRTLELSGAPDRFGTARPYDLYDREGRPLSTEQTPFVRALRGEGVVDQEIELRWRDRPRSRKIRASAYRLPSVGSEKRRVLISLRDVTEDLERQEVLASFAGNVAHDLRTPLTIIEAWTEMLDQTFVADGDVPAATGTPMTAKIIRAAARMRELIQSQLEFTLARDRPLTREPVDLAALAEEVAELRRDSAATTGAAPVITVSGSGVAFVDPVLVRLVIDNLVGNAVKYVAPDVRPQVLVTVDDTGDHVTLCVTDNGIGIAADQRERVFDAFHRVEQNQAEGSGLGLGICHRIVARHGGRIRILPDSRVGTTVEVTLPRAVSEPHLTQR